METQSQDEWTISIPLRFERFNPNLNSALVGSVKAVTLEISFMKKCSMNFWKKLKTIWR
jgi:hypothetical protein